MLLTVIQPNSAWVSADDLICTTERRENSLGQLKLRVVDSTAAWGELGEAWDDLIADCVYPNVFSTFAWQRQWWQSFREGHDLQIVVLESGPKLVGLLPLFAERRRGRGASGRLRLIGHGAAVMPDYLGFIVRQGFVEAATSLLVEHLAQSGLAWKSLVFEEFAAEDTGTNHLVQLLASRFPSVVRRAEPRWFIGLPDSYDAYLQALSSHNRQKKKNRLRQARRKYDAQLLEISHEDLNEWLPRIAELTAKARARHGRPSSFDNAAYADFHRQLLAQLMPSGQARLFVLHYGTKVAAYWYLLCFEGKVYAYQSAADPSQPGSPGDVALQMVIRKMIEEGFQELDFLCGDHSYKRGYTSTSRPTHTAHIFRRANASYFSRVVVERVLRPAKRSLRGILSARTSKQAAVRQ